MNKAIKGFVFCAILALLPAAPACAKPVYLACSIAGTDMELALDEDRGSADIYIDRSMLAEHYSAMFYHDTVVFSDPRSRYMIGRSTLKVVRMTPITKSVDEGACRLLPIPAKRAF